MAQIKAAGASLEAGVFLMDDRQVILFVADYLMAHLNEAQLDIILDGIAQGKFGIQDFQRNLRNAKDIAAIPIEAITGMYTDAQRDDKLYLTLCSSEAGMSSYTLPFQTSEEKDRFLESLQGVIQHEFTCEKQKNTIFGSIKKQLKALLFTLLIGGILSWLAYYMETSDSHSFRVPALFYVVVVVMEFIGYLPVILLTGFICLFIVVKMLRNMILGTERLIIERR